MLAQLRPDFPDVTISKIRFLESEGLVRPARTASGYRQFTSADVDRLRYVLSAQRDRYLPLKVIKEQLEAADHGASKALRAADLAPPAGHRVTREDLLARAGVEPGVLADLERHGLIRAGAGGLYDHEAVQIASTVRAMVEHGVPAHHLHPFRAAADHDVGLVEQVVGAADRQRDRAGADDVVREVAALSVTLHALLVKVGLRDVVGRPVSPR